jgi:hypothetical protein
MTMMRETNEVLNRIRVGTKLGFMKQTAFFLTQKMQMAVDVPTFWGAYYKALDTLDMESARNQIERNEIEASAVQLANQAVIDSQAGGQIKDQARVQRGSPLYKLFTNFYSYFSATYNLNVEAFRKTNFKSLSSQLNFLGDMIIINSLPAVFAVALREMMKGDCNGDAECLAGKYAQEQMSFITGQMVGVREITPAVQALAGVDYYPYSGITGLSPIKYGVDFAKQLSQWENDRAAWKAGANFVGSMTHTPLPALYNALDGFRAIEEGEVEGFRAFMAPLAGPPRK